MLSISDSPHSIVRATTMPSSLDFRVIPVQASAPFAPIMPINAASAEIISRFPMIGLWHCLKSFSTGKNAGEQTTIVAWSNCASHEPKIKTPQGRFNFWLTIVNELRTVYYHDIIRLAPELEKVNEITKNLYFHKNCNRIAL